MHPVRRADIERLFAEQADDLFAFLAYRCGDRELAKDVVADTFEAAFRARRRFDRRKASERTWLYAIALNRLRDIQRRAGAETRALERVAVAAVPVETHGSFDDRDAVMRAMDCLTPEEREAIALRFGADLTLKDIASVLDEPMSTVEGRVYRALRKLRAELE